LLGRQQDGAKADFPHFSLVRVSSDNVIVETVKKTEDSNRIVIRAYEAFNQRGPVELVFHDRLVYAAIANGLEEEVEKLEMAGNRLVLHFLPFEIKTLLIEFEGH
jgi:alpha-mannosidase